MPVRSAQEVPDLELLVQEKPGSGKRAFDLLLKARDPELDLNYRSCGVITLWTEPGEFFRQQLGEIWKGKPRKASEWASFAALLRNKGAYLSETVLPRELRDRLSALRGTVRSLLIQSDDPWIPWEILCVPETPGGEAADGPFLCEAFALTRWLSGVRQTLSLPVQRIAVVVPRDSDLPQAEGEYEDLLALAREETRRVERIPARLSDLQKAFHQGEHDGWHFTGHGTHRESDPDLSSLWLEEDEELTPVHLSGKARKLGLKRPLVFLNACSSGKSGLSLAGAGGWAPHFLKAGAGCCIGTLWPIDDGPARAFARAFYRSFIAGAPIAEAVWSARREIRSEGNPTWLAYTAFAHPLAICAPPIEREPPAEPPSSWTAAPPPEPDAPPRWRNAGIAAGIVLLLLIFAAGWLTLANPGASPEHLTEPLKTEPPKKPAIQPVPAAESKTEQKPAASPAVPPRTKARSTAVSTEGLSGGTAQGISFRISAGSGFPKYALTQALKNAAEPLAGMGISGWTLSLEAGPPRLSSVDMEGVPGQSCELTAYGHARRPGTSLDLGPVHAKSAQFDSTEACEHAAKSLAEAAVYQLVFSIRKKAT
jgi:hypothetical protein